MIGGLVIAALAAAQPAATLPGAGPLLRIEQARVVAVGRRDLPGSGIFAVYAHFDIASPGGAPERMYLLWAGPQGSLPQAGVTCAIGYRREPLLGGNMHEHDARSGLRDDNGLHNVVYELNCGWALATSLDTSLAAPVPLLPEPGFFPWARVVRAAPQPPGGMFLFVTAFEVQTLDGQRHRMVRHGSSADQFVPSPGSICSIRFHPGRPYPGLGLSAVNEVRDLNCDTGRDPEELADGRRRLYGVTLRLVSAPPPLRHAPGERYATLRMDAAGVMPQLVYLPVGAAEEDVTLPPAGARCSAVVRYDMVTGRSIGVPRLPDDRNAPIIEVLDCGQAQWFSAAAPAPGNTPPASARQARSPSPRP